MTTMKAHPTHRPVTSLAAALVALAAFLCASPALADELSAVKKADVDDLLKVGVPERTQSTDGRRNDALPRVLLIGGK